MRLKENIVQIIVESSQTSFGTVDIYLFGSRTDDSKKGGDIDIAIDIELSREEFRSKKAKFIATLLRKGFDLKIDLVPYNAKDPLLHSQIRKNSIKLN